MNRLLSRFQRMSSRKQSLVLWLLISGGYLILPIDLMPLNLADDAAVAAIATLFESIHQVVLCFKKAD